MQTGFFLYRSIARLPDGERGLRAVLDEARERNRRLELTGYLHLEDGIFFQWLEGPPGPLAEVAAMIERDPRHRDLRYLSRGMQPARRFDGWRMGFGVSEPGTLFQWVADQRVSPLHDEQFAQAILGFFASDDVRGVAEAL